MKRVIIFFLAVLLSAALACTAPETPAVTEQPAEPAAQKTAVPAESSEPAAPTEEPAAEPAEPDPTRPPVPEEPEAEPLTEEEKDDLPLSRRVIGEWYTEIQGLVITMELAEDGSYSISAPGAEPLTGSWNADTGDVIFDGEEGSVMEPVNGMLSWEAAGLVFTREKPETYVPSEVKTDAAEGSFDGFWKARFVGAGDAVIHADALGDDTIVYIEGTNVALGGKWFGKIIRVFSYEAGALVFEEDGTAVKIQLQEDGILRLTLTGGKTAVIYLTPEVIPGQTPLENP